MWIQPNITDAENLTGADIPMEIQISIALPDTREPMVASVQDLWVGADWNEKENLGPSRNRLWEP